MELLCRFGADGCGVEEVVAFVTLIAALVGLVAGLAAGVAYVRAAGFSKPVVEGLEARLKLAEGETQKATAKAAAAMEVATGRAAIESLVSSVATLVTESASAHREQSVVLKAHDERAQAHDKLIVHALDLVVAKLDPDTGRRDRRSSDRSHV